jgi:PAS domain-containing protein
MEVFEVEDGMTVHPNCAYIIPPGQDMAFLNGTLQLLEPSAPRGRRMPIDFFFRSLALDQLDRAVGIVLSGTGSDGTIGIRAIKGNGGMVMVQNPASTEYDGMPRSALSTGLVDYELPPAEMPAQLIAYAAHAFGKPRKPVTEQPPTVENALKKIFILLRAHTGQDFSQHKPSTVHRRMAIHQIETIDEYVRYLQQARAEVETLFRDILIGVTNFFRDPEAFRVVKEQIIPRLFIGKSQNRVITEAGDETNALIVSLQQELQAKEEYLQIANEELRSSNEEMQSVNEELQSTNEELETSKEELQSVNEELFTVNAELQTKVVDLTRTNNDMNNLLAGTGIATVFVDHSLRILRFTPAATRIINLIQSDMGRPVGHIVSNLIGYNTLPEDTQDVLDTLSPKEVEVQTRTGAWYMMRILPYRTLDNVIEGAVITFVDISAAKRAQEALHEAHLRVTEAIVATVREPMLVMDPDLRIILANRPFYSTFRIAPDNAVGRLLYDLDNRRWDIPALRKLLEKILPKVPAFNDYLMSHEFEDIGLRTIRLNACMVSQEGRSEFILLAIEDITEQKNEEGSL